MRKFPSATLLALGFACGGALAAPCAGFGDVDAGDTAYCAAVTYLKNKGVTSGCGDGSNYCPNDYVTRLQMALFMMRMGRGGPANTLGNSTTSIGGGNNNQVGGQYSTIAGGSQNQATSEGTAVGGGVGNWATSAEATIGGGYGNRASDNFSSILGGYGNQADGVGAVIGGGTTNVASGNHSVIPGGVDNETTASYAFAAGRRSKANGTGSFSFADSNDVDFITNTANSFRVRATGGVRFVVDIDANGDTTWSCLLTTGNGWSCSSDRNLKQDLVELDGGAVLDRLAAMPVYAWSPKGRNADQRHYGPMAQDFHAAFGLGDSDVLIGQQDADGVALAAIKGLHARVVAQDRELDRTRDELVATRHALDAIRGEIAALKAAR